jgi:thioredoxin-like negative regulator of GroEL
VAVRQIKSVGAAMPGIAFDRETGLASIKQHWRLVLLLAVVAGGLLWGLWRRWEVRRYRRAMSEIAADLEAGRHGLAARKLVALLASRRDSDEAAYLLGKCERARGRIEAASEAWARIPPDSPFAPRVSEGHVELEIERGRLADAEEVIKHAVMNPRCDAPALSLLLGTVYSLQGRVEEAERFIEAAWDNLERAGQGAAEPAITLLRLHIELQRTSTPVEAIRAFLDKAAASAPDDDRVWLGKANLALRAGSYDEAARWLDACLRRRPDDVPVWRARLNLAMATGRAAEAHQAMAHLPAAESTPAEIQALGAWFSRKRGDSPSQRRALERLITADPTDVAALDRLAELAVKDGQPDGAAELLRKKLEIDRLQTRYRKLYDRYQPKRDAAEMASLAEQLGHRFEAKAFLTVAVAVYPDRHNLRVDLTRLKQQSEAINEPGRTLAELLAPATDGKVGASTNSASPSGSFSPRPRPDAADHVAAEYKDVPTKQHDDPADGGDY